MAKFDDIYFKLIDEILKKGTNVKNNIGLGLLSIPYYTFEFDLNKEFPNLELREICYEDAITEMLWMWQMQSNDVRELQKEMYTL